MHGGRPATREVDQVTAAASEGWLLGSVLAAALAEQRRAAGTAFPRSRTSARRPTLRSYLSEEFLDSLDSELREAAIRSSVARVITPAVAAALELPADFSES